MWPKPPESQRRTQSRSSTAPDAGLRTVTCEGHPSKIAPKVDLGLTKNRAICPQEQVSFCNLAAHVAIN